MSASRLKPKERGKEVIVKKQQFQVTAKVVVEVSIDINATDFSDAVEQSKALETTDFVDIRGEYLDGEHLIVNVSLQHEWPSDAVKR